MYIYIYTPCVSDTSAVQEVEVVEGEECVAVTCYFAAGSTAQGCAVQMRIVNTYTSQHLHTWQFNVSQDPQLLQGTLHVPLEPKASAVDVVVYDWTATGRIGLLSIPPLITHSSNAKCRSVYTYVHHNSYAVSQTRSSDTVIL